MKGTTHAIVGACTAAVAMSMISGTSQIFGIPVDWRYIIVTAPAFALKADADQPNSPERRGYKIIWTAIQKTPILKFLFGHRGATHAPILVPPILLFFASQVGADAVNYATLLITTFIVGGFLGYSSHLAVDPFNGKGTPFLFPAILRKIHIMSITSETIEEVIFLIVFVVLAIAQIYLVKGGMVL